jgi:S1-C subfamily serine protease
VVAANGQAVGSVDDLHRLLAEWPIGKTVEITLIRGTERKVLAVTPLEAANSIQ